MKQEFNYLGFPLSPNNRFQVTCKHVYGFTRICVFELGFLRKEVTGMETLLESEDTFTGTPAAK